MALQELAPELLLRVFESLSSIFDIINLSLTCRYFSKIVPTSQRLTLFFDALDATDGPVQDIIQLLTQNNNQLLHVQRTPPLSFALLSQVSGVACVARRYVDLYPRYRWPEGDTIHRRCLDSVEARRLQRAVYRVWIYAKAFHQSSHQITPTTSCVATDRLRLLRTWSNHELLELEDVRGLMEQLVATEICPTDGEVYSRVPEDAPRFQLSLQYPHLRPISTSTSAHEDLFHYSRNSDHTIHSPTAQEIRFRHMEGWGTDLENYHVVQSMLKFSPAQILCLLDNAICRGDVERFIEQQAPDRCFFDSGSLLFQDWVTILQNRGIDVQRAREAVWNGNAGILCADEKD